jgi:EAL domain-containing protein (putative c-di-GMP-specific phosphodiesterase class I)
MPRRGHSFKNPCMALGCHHAQGFYFSRPVTAEEIGELLEAGAPVAEKPV